MPDRTAFQDQPAPADAAASEVLPRVPIASGGQQAARRIDRAALAAAYEAGDSTTDLAHRHGVSAKTVSTMLKVAGVHLRSIREARQVRAQNTWLHLDRPEPVHGRPEVEDVFGVVHRVASLSLTDFGWAILRGYPVGTPSATGIILTGELVTYLERYRLQPGRIDLPLSQFGSSPGLVDLGATEAAPG